MTYVDCFIAAVPTANKDAYLAHAQIAAAVFRDHGATEVIDCWGDDVPPGERTSFPLAVKCEEDETVAIGWVRWSSKETRDAGIAKVMSDPRMAHGSTPIPFDGKRLIFGGFQLLLEA